jgi:hypothetical protein
MALELRERIAADVAGVLDPVIRERLEATGQIVNLREPADFASGSSSSGNARRPPLNPLEVPVLP